MEAINYQNGGRVQSADRVSSEAAVCAPLARALTQHIHKGELFTSFFVIFKDKYVFIFKNNIRFGYAVILYEKKLEHFNVNYSFFRCFSCLISDCIMRMRLIKLTLEMRFSMKFLN